MKKTIQARMSLVFVVVMLLTIAAPSFSMQAKAATNPFDAYLEMIQKVYPAGSYFTANRQACSHSSTEKCDNCKLATILNSNDCNAIKLYENAKYNSNTWTCFSFVSFWFTQYSGKKYVDSNIIKVKDTNDWFDKPTDFAKQSDSFKKQFFSYARIGFIIKCFNWTGEKYTHKHSMIFISADDTGVTVYDANVNGSSSATGTVRYGKIKYSNMHWNNIELLKSTNYDEIGEDYAPKITFNGNDGTASKSYDYYVAGKTYGDAFPSAVRNGYTFEGWFTNASGGDQITRGTTVTSGNKTLYAHWIPNETDILQVGHIYRIINEKSGMCLRQKERYTDKTEVVQVAPGSSGDNGEYWRVIYADSYGYYKLENLDGCKAMDMNATDKWAYRNHLYTYKENNNSDAQFFSIIYRGAKTGYSGLYSIHSKNTGRVINVSGGSVEAGAAMDQWDYHGDTNQQFYFEEVTERNVLFYDNLNNNYIVSPAEEYARIHQTTPTGHYKTLHPESVTVTLDPDENALIIQSKKAGGKNDDMQFETTIQGSYDYDFQEMNTSTMTLRFKAKSSVAGAKINFRWGFTQDVFPVELTTSWKEYTVTLPRTRTSGSNLHPFVDKVCTIEMKDIALYESGTDGYIGDTDAYTVQTVYADVMDWQSCNTPLPTTTKAGCTFDGWYTKRVGGEKVADGNAYYIVSNLYGAQKLYAHWVEDDTPHIHDYETTVHEPDCENAGYTTYVCRICGASFEDDYVPALGHDYDAHVISPTCTEDGFTRYTCTRCGNIVESDFVPALKHNYGEWTMVDNDWHQRVCANDKTHIEKEPHAWDDGVVTLEPTANADGIITYTCYGCGGTREEAIPKADVISITVFRMQQKTVYTVGDTLDTTGLILTANLSNGTSETVTSGYICTPTVLTKAGTQTITVSYGGKTTTFNVTVQKAISDNEPSLILSKQKAKAGDRVDVTLSIANNPGIVATSVNLTYDKTKLRLVGVKDGGLLGDTAFSPGNDLTAVPYTVIWEDGLATQNHMENGVLATFTFEVLENAPVGETPITLNYVKNSTFDVNLDEVEFALSAGSIEVFDRTPGDANKDGVVDLKDVVVLRRFLSGGWDVTVDASNSDVNGDHVVDLKDAVILRRYLSGGWNITLQ